MASSRRTNQSVDEISDEISPEQWAEFMTPQQRLTAIADILSTIAIRIVKKRHENNQEHNQPQVN